MGYNPDEYDTKRQKPTEAAEKTQKRRRNFVTQTMEDRAIVSGRYS